MVTSPVDTVLLELLDVAEVQDLAFSQVVLATAILLAYNRHAVPQVGSGTSDFNLSQVSVE